MVVVGLEGIMQIQLEKNLSQIYQNLYGCASYKTPEVFPNFFNRAYPTPLLNADEGHVAYIEVLNTNTWRYTSYY